MSQDILIVVNCEAPLQGTSLPSNAVQMFAADKNIVQNNSQGGTELWVKVPPETNLRWRAVPLQLKDGDDKLYTVVISSVKLWGANSAGNSQQLDAYTYLGEWYANEGTAYGAGYSPAQQTLSFSDPAPGSSSTNQQPISIAKVTHSDPFIQSTCNGAMSTASQYVAYSFTCTVYKNGVQYATVSWDPYVTVI